MNRESLRRVRLLSLDVDGVQTDGGLYYTETGAELRRYHVRDGMGIKLLMAAGIHVAFISQSTTASIAERGRKLGVTRCLTGIDDKLAALSALCDELRIPLDAVAHMADDVNDLPLLRAVGLPMAVADAVPAVLSSAAWVSTLPGGRGAVREACDLLLSAV
jgi:3-deoxy-D-manno-octulosonate 8-phosphate phosphatase (KDO 8-P phosphatase)